MNEPRKTDTKIHLILSEILEEIGFRVEREAFFPPYFIDCFVSEIFVGFEADGEIWHSKKMDRKRDLFLWETYRLPIKRISGKKLLIKNNEKIKSEILFFVEEYSESFNERRLFFSKKTLDSV